MRKTWTILIAAGVMLGISSCRNPHDGGSAVTTATLFEEMTDLLRLTYFPEPAFRTLQFSSFDRRSRIPGGPDWFANSDGFGGEPIPNFEEVLEEPDENGIGKYLMADVAGPGAVVRLWSAAISGEIALHLDDRVEPVYRGQALDFFHRTLDHFPEVEALDRSRLEKTLYQRDACYAPIPFARRMRLEWTGDLKTIHFYQVQVRLYVEGTRVTTFAPADLRAHAATIDRVTAALADPDRNLAVRSHSDPITFSAQLAPDAVENVYELAEAGALERLTLRLQAEDVDRALRQTLLHVTCDGYPWGQVQSPVGDFFGAAPGINPYQSLPFSVLPDGTMICRFIMPCAERLTVRLENRGAQHVSVQGSALPMDYVWDAERSQHFRARWRVDHALIASNRAVQDLPFLLAQGKGLYVGTAAYLLNPSPVPTPYGSWWGEGDEKVFVDDGPHPDIFGTGSEDYFNYSWSSPDIFFFPYCGQPRNDGPGNRGFVTNFRWHILDPIPFQHNIRFFIELFSHETIPGLSYARTAYHYAHPGITDDHTAIMPEDLRAQELPADWQPAARMGARNSVIYAAEDLITSRSGTRFQEGRLWAGGRLLTWRPRAVGETKSFMFTLDSDGIYRIHLTVALTPEGGRLEAVRVGELAVTLRDQPTAIDLHRPHRHLLRSFALQDLDLEKGRHTLVLRYVGASPGIRSPEIGIDFIRIEKIER